MTIESLIDSTKELFEKRYGYQAEIACVAPGRVNLIGGHVDYNHGIVLPLAIDRHTIIVGAINHTNQINIYSEHFDDSISIDLADQINPVKTNWHNYVLGVLAGFAKKDNRLLGFDGVLCSNIPVGGGLSSSAALEVAIATFLETISNVKLNEKAKALLCQKAEHDFARMPCGVMDQFTSVSSRQNHLTAIDCRSLQVEYIPWPDNDFCVLVINSNTPHHLVESEYKERRNECAAALAKLNQDSFRDLSMEILDSNRARLNYVEYHRARHVVTEIERCLRTIDAIKKQDFVLAGQQLYNSHSSLRDDFEVSCPELDFLVEAGRDIGTDGGVLGMRMTGGGFGGCVVAIVRADCVHDIAESICKGYSRKFGVAADWFFTQPVQGATRVF